MIDELYYANNPDNSLMQKQYPKCSYIFIVQYKSLFQCRRETPRLEDSIADRLRKRHSASHKTLNSVFAFFVRFKSHLAHNMTDSGIELKLNDSKLKYKFQTLFFSTTALRIKSLKIRLN